MSRFSAIRDGAAIVRTANGRYKECALATRDGRLFFIASGLYHRINGRNPDGSFRTGSKWVVEELLCSHTLRREFGEIIPVVEESNGDPS